MSLPIRTASTLPLWVLPLVLLGANYWAYTVEIETDRPAAITAPDADPAAAAAVSEPQGLSVPAPGDLTETLARPLFLAERRPVQRATAPAAPEATAAPAPLELELAGTMQANGSGMALIRTPEKREGQWVKAGAKIGAWTLLEIRGDGALIERDGTRAELRIKTDQAESMRPPAP